jgi:hypothetical protein
MATNSLSPELLALLQQQNAGTYNKNNLQAILSGGRYYMPEYGGGGGGGEGGFDNPGTFNGYQSYREEDAGAKQGTGQFFGADGTYKNDYEWKDDNLNEMLFALAAGGLAMIPGGMASTLSGGGAAGTGAAGAEGVSGMGYVNGADLMSDAFVANGGVGVGGFGGTSGSYLSNLVNGTGSLGSRVLGGTGAAEAGTAASTAAKVAGGASTLGGLLGPAAAVLGGLAGSQGQKTEQTSERKTDPRVDPYLFGDGTNPGLLGYTQQLLARQMAPGGLQGYDDMRRVGQGLLAAPVAGNGFSRFSNR